jgi:hypothetical protein|tara:strand:+ start:37 stop:408 length:372 start_codon:yes stop_codon:yes gene_type:complete
MDRLENIFKLRREFMEALSKKIPESHPDRPLDLSSKEDQQFCRDLALRGVEEMFEALQHLKNWKPHRVSEIKEFNREDFLEEVVDAFNYFFSLVILAGFDENDLYDVYLKKDKIIHDRLDGGY